ncbi:hypothetical protein [Bradyrhizobium sp. BR 10289]|uniref:hypothetical protein n=1 Tax=Bradyrhizobium sp. BR 10289 TaxID=2749993 RepID=UPI001C64F286|nr:hypothetical protein [Bradyrhizobium sp. BR 10289]MBW7974068.1 hypothetical protein [Bradyrhizobium sp. BR 10289]
MADEPAVDVELPAVDPVLGDAGADFAGALGPPPLLSAGVFRLEAPAPAAPPVPEELMLLPVLDAPDPFCASAGNVVIRAAPSTAMARIFMAAAPVQETIMEGRARLRRR